jgi:hypothetical protein
MSECRHGWVDEQDCPACTPDGSLRVGQQCVPVDQLWTITATSESAGLATLLRPDGSRVQVPSSVLEEGHLFVRAQPEPKPTEATA